MRVYFKDGTQVEHVLAVTGISENGRFLLKTAEGDVVADLDPADIDRVEGTV